MRVAEVATLSFFKVFCSDLRGVALKLLITYLGKILRVGLFCCNFSLAKKRQKMMSLPPKK